MADDLIPTTAVADLLGKSVATINRWAAEKRPDVPQPALTLPGDTGARLYRRAEVEAYRASQIDRAIASGACPDPDCTNQRRQTWHNDGPCPNAKVAAS